MGTIVHPENCFGEQISPKSFQLESIYFPQHVTFIQHILHYAKSLHASDMQESAKAELSPKSMYQRIHGMTFPSKQVTI